MASSARIDELKKKFDENPRRYFAPLANEFRKGGDLDQAILICEEFLPQQPGHMSGHIVYGQALFENGRLDEARTVFETALSLDPENLIALRHLGDIAAQQGDPSAARRWYERVLEADPRNDEIQQLIAGLDEGQHAASAAPASAPEPEHGGWRADSGIADDVPQQAVASHAPEPDLIDLDLTVPGGVPVVAEHASHSQSAYDAPDSDARDHFDALSLSGIVPMPDAAELMPPVEARALGFEATEFEAPAAPVEQAAGLQSAFEDETSIHGAAVAPLDGLDTPHQHEPAGSEALPDLDALPELDEDDGLVLPPHGDPVVETPNTPASTPALADLAALDREFAMPYHSASAAPSFDAAVDDAPTHEAPDLMEFDVPAEPATQLPHAVPVDSAPPVELPPEVIAAEAELIDEGMSMEQPASSIAESDASADSESIGSELTFLDTAEEESAPVEVTAASGAHGDEAEELETAPAAQRPFVTETMAELYLKQGFHEQALSVYQQLSEASPDDARLADKVASLRAAAATPAQADAGPTIRDFFARLAARRPGERGAASVPPDENDFATPEPVASHEPVPSTQPESHAPAIDERAVAPGTGGTIDALFGNRPIGTSEDSAASALAQAFGASAGPSAPPITGNPARQATGELSLDSVFRDGGSRGPRTSQGFSFDQFFSQNTEGDRTSGSARTSQEVPLPGEPAEKSADDIEQFNSWLQGLKNR
jgi:tetratricopeptide (TPR) repeat protein